MSEPFDPYHKWLGIPPADQPANYYRLLGLELFEDDPEVIQRAADRQMNYLHGLCDGPQGEIARRLLNELSAATRHLLEPSSKRVYDSGLRAGQHIAQHHRDDAVPRPPGQSPPTAPPVVATAIPLAAPVTAQRVKEDVPQRAEPAIPVIAPAGTLPRHAKAAARRTSLGKKATTVQAPQETTAEATVARSRRLVLLSSSLAGAALLIMMGLWFFRDSNSASRQPRKEERSIANSAAPAPPLTTVNEPPVAAASVADGGEFRSNAAAEAALSAQEPSEAASPTLEDPSSESIPAAASFATADRQAGAFRSYASAETVTEFPYQGLVLWLDAADQDRIEIDQQGRLSRWYDGSKERNDAIQPDAAARPFQQSGTVGRPLVRFDGANWLTVADDSSLDWGDAYTVFLVAGGSSGVPLDKGDGYQPNGLSLWNGMASLRAHGKTLNSGDPQPADVRLHVLVGDSQRLRWFIGGELRAEAAIPHGVQNDQPLLIGRREKPSDPRFFTGYIAEIVAYNRPLADAERRFVERYLTSKWLTSAASLAADAAGSSIDTQAPPPPSTGSSAETTVAKQEDDESLPAPRGFLQREVWRDVSGNKVEDFLRYAASQPQPTERSEIEQLETPEDDGDNYGQRLRGYLHPPLSGTYVFSMRANAEGLLYLSPDENPENKQRVEVGRPITLQANQPRYLEAWHKESTGKDYFSIGWTLPDGTSETPIPGERLSVAFRLAPEHARQFIVLRPISATASAGSSLQIAEDGAVHAEGMSSTAEDYQLDFELPMRTITAIRLEALPRDDLPAKGPGRASGGRAAISEVELFTLDGSDPSAPMSMPSARVVSHQGADLTRLADGNAETIWRLTGRGQPASATWHLGAPLPVNGARLRVVIRQRESLGSLRLLATSATKPDDLKAQGTNAPASLFSLRVNLGGESFTGSDGSQWVKSKSFDNATFGHEGGTAVSQPDVANPVQATALRGINAFRAVVPNGTYDVTLFFCEYWSSTGRTFAITAEHRVVAARLELLRAAGGFALPLRLPLPGIVVDDERLDLEFQPAPGSTTLLNAILIQQVK